VSDRWRVLTLRAYRRGDERAFAPRADMLKEAAAVAWEWTRLGPPGPTWSLIRAGTGKVVGIGGGVEQRRGDWQLWCVLGELGWKDWPSAIACAATIVRRLEHDFRARHLVALARDGFAPAALVLRRMGFAYYGPSLSWQGYTIFERWDRRRREGVK
jgi:hypothetical protein